MTVSSTHSNKVFTASGSQTDFVFDFKCYEASSIQVFLDYSDTAESSGYSVSLDTDYEGGTVTFSSPPANGTRVDIQRIRPLTQATDYPVGGSFPSETHEKALDYLTMILQQQQRVIEEGTGYVPVAGEWATSTAYKLNQWVYTGTKWYYCAEPHTSGTFATDLAAGYWVYLMDSDESASAIAAAASAAAALQSENNAATSETNAATSETNASNSASAASTSETNAGLSAVTASGWEEKAEKWAEEDEDVQVETAKYSAKHWAAKAEETADGIADTAEAAALAEKWATEAEDTPVETGKYSAYHWAQKAEDQKTLAAAQVTLAEGHADDAETAKTGAETAYDNFDDRYLGDKASDPTLDNDGEALLTGALYFNTTSNIMKVYTGSAWSAAYVDEGSYLTAADVDDTPVNGATTDPVSSNWAYDHENLLTAHGTFVEKDSDTGAGNLPAGTTAQRPGSPAAGMIRYNSTEESFEGHDGTEWGAIGGGGGLELITTVTTATTAEAGQRVPVDTDTSALTITLPASPEHGDTVGIIDVTGNAGTNNITVGRNSESISGAAEDFIIDLDRGAVTFQYVTTEGWTIIESFSVAL